MMERLWRNRNTFTLLVGVYSSSTIVEDSVAIPQDLEIEIPFDPAIQRVYIQRTTNRSTIRTHAHKCSLQHCLQ